MHIICTLAQLTKLTGRRQYSKWISWCLAMFKPASHNQKHPRQGAWVAPQAMHADTKKPLWTRCAQGLLRILGGSEKVCDGASPSITQVHPSQGPSNRMISFSLMRYQDENNIATTLGSHNVIQFPPPSLRNDFVYKRDSFCTACGSNRPWPLVTLTL